MKIALPERNITAADMPVRPAAEEISPKQEEPTMNDARTAAVSRPHPLDALLTFVELTWHSRRIENRIRFGRQAGQQILDRHRRVVSFTPGSVFCFVRWAANDYGTILSRADIVRAVSAAESYQTLPFVRPGGRSLLRADGWPRVERVLQMIDAVEALGIDPADAAPDYWRHVHNRLSVNETPRAYNHTRHRAWLLRRGIGS